MCLSLSKFVFMFDDSSLLELSSDFDKDVMHLKRLVLAAFVG